MQAAASALVTACLSANCDEGHTFKPTPLGSPPVEISDDTSRSFDQAVLPSGSALYTWQSDKGLMLKFFAPGLQPRGDAIKLSSDVPGSVFEGVPSLTVMGDDKFIIAWLVNTESEALHYAQVFSEDGTPEGAPFKMSSGPFEMNGPVIASLRAGFVSVWEDTSKEGGVFARVFDASRTAKGEAQKVNVDAGITGRGLISYSPQAAELGNGGFVVVWHLNVAPDEFEIRGRVFGADGVPTEEITVNSKEDVGQHLTPQVSPLTDGGFVVTWSFKDKIVFTRRYDSTGKEPSQVVQVNTEVLARAPSLVPLLNGGFFVVSEEGPVFTKIVGTFFDTPVVPKGPTKVLIQSDLVLVRPKVAVTPKGFVLAWTVNQKSFAQEFAPAPAGEGECSADA